ncbi:hypothetical protein GQ457_07G011020 [Hibiscus cannabinus]
MANRWNPPHPYWMKVWKLTIPQRLRLFTWLALNQKLMTNAERSRRGISSSPCCDLCGGTIETEHCHGTCSSLPAFGRYGKHVTIAFSQASLKTHPSLYLGPPPVGWVCLHVDGAINTGSGLGSIGGLFRNSEGSWMSGYGRSIGFSDALSSELWAIHDGLALAWNNGFHNLQVRSDCSMAISLIMNSDAAHSSHALVRAIVGFRRRSWSLDFTWVPREIIDRLILWQGKCHRTQFETLLFDQPPSCIHNLLTRDVNGPPYCKTKTS